MKRVMMIVLTVLLIVTATAYLYAGAPNRIGTGGAVQLLIPTGARDIAMGGSTVATTSGIEALFWNPAGIAKSTHSADVIFSHMSYIADIGVQYGAVAAKWEGIGTLALSVKSLSIGDIPVTTTQNPDGTGDTYSPQFIIAGGSYARQLSDRISVGITANLVSERMLDVSTSGVAFNIGIIYDNLADFTGLSLGIAVKNIGPQMKYDGAGLYQLASVATQNRPPQFYKIEAAPFELPSTIEIGIGYKTTFSEENSILVSTLFQNNNYADDEYKIGAEYAYENLLFVRGGWNFSPTADYPADARGRERDAPAYVFGPTVGAGVAYTVGTTDLAFDYAFRHTEYFKGNHCVSLRVGF